MAKDKTTENSSLDEIFPIKEEVEDFAGNIRAFEIRCEHFPDDTFALDAIETGKDFKGYIFRAYSEASPFSALGELRGKMRRALATRHITSRDGRYSLLHDTLRGRITCDPEQGLQLIVDGIPLNLYDLEHILSTHEGWQFRLEVVDPSEDITR